MRLVTGFILVALALSSCVSTKKYKLVQSQYQDTLGTMRLQADLLEQDTTQRGIKYRNLMSDKNFLEEKCLAEKEHCEKQISEKDEELQKKTKQLEEQGGLLTKLEKEYAQFQKVLDTIETELADSVKRYKKEQLYLERKNGELTLTFAENILFKPETAELLENRLKLLGYVTEILERHPQVMIYVTGHTDNTPPKSGFRDNWQLSASQASAFVAMLSDNYGLPGRRFEASGRAGAEPVASNDTVEGRQRNRRLTIELRPDPLVFYKIIDGK